MPKLCAMTTLHALANTHKYTWRGKQQHVLPIYLLTQKIHPQQNIELSTHTFYNENLTECDLTKISDTVGLTAKLFRNVLV